MTSFNSDVDAADSLLDRGQFGPAFDEYRRLLEHELRAQSRLNRPVSPRQLALTERVADLAFLTGHSSSAADLFDAARITLTENQNRYAADWMAVKAAAARLAAGQWARARDTIAHLSGEAASLDAGTIRDALPELERQWRWPGPGPGAHEDDRAALIARLLLELGKQCGAEGRYQAAIILLERALAYAARPTATAASAAATASEGVTRTVILELATATLERGELESCRAWLARGELHDRPDVAAGIRRREIEAQLAQLTGDLGRARESLEQVRAECIGLGLPMAAASASLNLASLLILLNETATADRIVDGVRLDAVSSGDRALSRRAQVLERLAYDRGQSLADRVAIAPSVTEVWNGQEPVASRADDDHHNEKDPATRIDDWPAGRSFLELFEMRALAFHWRLSRRDWAGARQYLAELDEVFASSDSLIIASRRMALEGLLLYYEGRWTEAARAMSEADEGFSLCGLVLDRWQTLRVRSWAKARLGDEAGTAADRAESERILAAMTSSLGGAQRAVFRLNKWTHEEEVLAHHLDELTRQTRETRQAAGAGVIQRVSVGLGLGTLRRLASHVAVHARIDAYRRGVIENVVERTADSTVDVPWWRVALRYAGRTACVRFVVLPDRLAILTLTGTRVTAGVTPVTRLELRQRVAALHRAIQDDARAAFDHQRSELARILQWDAILSVLPRRCRRLLVMPDDVLHGCPMAALGRDGARDGAPEPRVTIGLETWRRITRRRASSDLLVAMPNGNPDFPALPGAAREADVFTEWRRTHGRSVDAIDPSSPSRAAVLDKLPRARLAHFVGHGVFRPDRPDESGLMLIAADGSSELVSLRDLSHLDVSGLDLLTLSSCWGADSFVLPGRFVLSLPEVCWRAGARRVIASLWEVDDEVGTASMQRFYKYLDSHAPDEALARTRDDCRRNELLPRGALDTSHPFYWAGLQLYGD